MEIIVLILSVALTFTLSFLGMDYFLSRCGANERTSFVASIIFAILCAIFLVLGASRFLFG